MATKKELLEKLVNPVKPMKSKKTQDGLKVVLEVKNGKLELGRALSDYVRFKPLFKWLKEYAVVYIVEGVEIIIIYPIPPDVLGKMPAPIYALYEELIAMGGGPSSPVVHLLDCTLKIW